MLRQIADMTFTKNFNPFLSIKVVVSRLMAHRRAKCVFWRAASRNYTPDLHLIRLESLREKLSPHVGSARKLINSANRIIEGEYSVFSKTILEEARIPDWSKDYLSDQGGGESPLAKTQRHFDIKDIWELNRLQFLPTLGLAFLLTKERKYVESIKSTLQDWIRKNPVHSRPNWDSAMEVALRSVSIVITLSMMRDEVEKDEGFLKSVSKSLFEHGVFVWCNLEIGVFGTKSNHFFSDLLGLLVLGLTFREMKIGEQWSRYALSELENGIQKQVDDDGVYFEHSTSYHRFVLEIFAYSYLIGKHNDVTFSKNYENRLEKMFEFVWHYIRPDGLAAQAGDADDGRVFILTDYFNWDRRDHRYLLHFAAILFDRFDLIPLDLTPCVELFVFMGKDQIDKIQRGKEPAHDHVSKLFKSKIVVRRSKSDHLMVTAWDVGTDGIGNHQHNDILSFELTLSGVTFVVDPGTYCYTYDDQLRNLFRSTAYHNTVRIDDSEINRFDPLVLFRMSNDAKPQILAWHEGDDGFHCICQQRGYKSCSPNITHVRDFQSSREPSRYTISDRITAEGTHVYSSSFHLDHGVKLQRREGHFLLTKNGVRVKFTCDPADTEVETLDGWVSYSYLEKLPGTILRVNVPFQARLSISYAFEKL